MKTTSKFKTNAKCGGCVQKIGEKLNNEPEVENWSIDLENPDKTLLITSGLPDAVVVRLVNEAGFKAEKM
ncbi:heavy-metal-associated domain-containing protein [Coprobacter tertius]|uniref:Heavy-metal-associated domain-containing protein n=1 Tax=Coprobacter tertius TaxID=2944915 RepID=A0ABT1MKE7_9BACT|nr:heavy-metal-associated domain-containing protein [Coprobacter tertius]MCP9613090.1 heavy-metal-associated domain-containing protein [Coprobacter tertius]